jgi:hypothetical protein
MLYTPFCPDHALDRIRLFPSQEAARAFAGHGKRVLSVAVGFDAMMRRVVPLLCDPQAIDPNWSTPAQSHADGSVTAKGPIPEVLYSV